MEEIVALINLNKQAAEKISENNFKKALTLLLKAKSYLTDSTTNSLKTYTLINLSSVYARLNNLKKSLSILRSIAPKIEDKYLYSCTLLNIASLKSRLSKHEESLAHNIEAIELLKSLDLDINTSTSLVVAYRNISMLIEHLGYHREGLQFDQKAQQLALQLLDPGNPLAIALNKYKHISDLEPLSKRNTSVDISLASIRFLTGDRIEPMNKTGSVSTEKLSPLPKIEKPKVNKSFMLSKVNFKEPERIYRFGIKKKANLDAEMEENKRNCSKIYSYKKNIKEILIISLKELYEIEKRYKRHNFLLNLWEKNLDCNKQASKVMQPQDKNHALKTKFSLPCIDKEYKITRKIFESIQGEINKSESFKRLHLESSHYKGAITEFYDDVEIQNILFEDFNKILLTEAGYEYNNLWIISKIFNGLIDALSFGEKLINYFKISNKVVTLNKIIVLY